MSVGNLFLTTNKIPLLGRKGLLKPDSDGYYELPIGGFNCKNSIGEVYTMENIEALFASSSDLQRKIQSGKMMGEWGHPEPKPTDTPQSFMQRASMVSDKETCAFFKEVWLDNEVAKSDLMKANNIDPNTVVTMGKVKPHGSKWEALQRALDDPNCNISFSVRNLSYDKTVRGVVYVVIAKIITWDAVIDPGIKAASKWLSPRLESRRVQITPNMIDGLEKHLESNLVRQEASQSTQELVQASREFFALKQGKRSGFADW
jgi:hypothetical protein